MMMSSNYRRLTANLAMGMFHNHRYSYSNINPYSIARRNPTTRLFQYNNLTSSSSSSNTSIADPAGEKLFEDDKQRYEIVPENECESIRLRLILKDIIDALHREVASKESDDGHFGAQATTKHLDRMNWEILLVLSSGTEEPMYCFPGKIVANTSILQHFKTDDEIATLIAHEVGHVVARHVAEKITKKEWYSIIDSISSLLIVFFSFSIPIPYIAGKILSFGGKLSHYQQSKEFEADYIGLMLMASAGYDPMNAPEVYKKLGFHFGNTTPSPDRTHPCGEERAMLLRKEMDKALTIYKKVKIDYSIQQRKEGGLILTVKEGGGIDIDANPKNNCA